MLKKGRDAKKDFDKAKSVNRRAERVFDDAKEELEVARDNAHSAMEQLGECKFAIYQQSIIPFAEAFQKIKNIDFKESSLTDGSLAHSRQQLQDITNSALEMKEVVVGGVTALGAGGLAGLAAYGSVGLLGTASTGTAIGTLSGAAATNATLAWLGGGSLAAGGLGIAGGTAVLGGLVAAPVLAVGGMMLASKAEAAVEDARANLHNAEVAAEDMKTAMVATRAIAARFVEVNNVLSALNERFEPLLNSLQDLVAENQDYQSYSVEDQKGIFFCVSLAKTIKNVLETPLLSDSGKITSDSTAMIGIANQTLEAIDEGQGGELFEQISASTPREVIVEEKVSKKTLNEFFYRHRDFLNNDSSVYCGLELCRSKTQKKIDNAVQAYAHQECYVDREDKYAPRGTLEVFIDTTVFGSGKEGFYITDEELIAKPFMGDRFYVKLEDIRHIEIDEDNTKITINYEDIDYVQSGLNSRMKVVVDVLNQYINQ